MSRVSRIVDDLGNQRLGSGRRVRRSTSVEDLPSTVRLRPPRCPSFTSLKPRTKKTGTHLRKGRLESKYGKVTGGNFT